MEKQLKKKSNSNYNFIKIACCREKMKTKKTIKNIMISIIIGIALGSITEFALILNINWMVKITQSFVFWGIVMCICALISKDYALALINPILVMTLMNSTYYIIRLIMSGYTNIGGWELFALTGIAGSMYIGTIVFFIKECYHKQNNISHKYNFIFMTISGILFTIYGWYNIPIRYNLFYNIDIGIMVGFVISTVIKMKKLRNI